MIKPIKIVWEIMICMYLINYVAIIVIYQPSRSFIIIIYTKMHLESKKAE